MKTIPAILLLLLPLSVGAVDEQRLADAIFKSENSRAHPYGVMRNYQHTNPRQACINTIKHTHDLWLAQGRHGNYINFLSRIYCPIQDGKQGNINWLRNVSFFYHNPK